MSPSEFFSKLYSSYVWKNIAAMFAVVVALVVAVSIGLDFYTHHGESVAIPDLTHESMMEARHQLEEAGLEVEVSDTGYVKSLPADCVLEQTPAAGTMVKPGHVVYLVINASSTPSISLPDIIENCSMREAMAKLKAMGFKVGMPKYVPGEKDWVYGVTVDGRHLAVGDRVLIDKTVILLVGNGMMDAADSVEYIDSNYGSKESDDEGGFEEEYGSDIDDFEEVE